MDNYNRFFIEDYIKRVKFSRISNMDKKKQFFLPDFYLLIFVIQVGKLGLELGSSFRTRGFSVIRIDSEMVELENS